MLREDQLEKCVNNMWLPCFLDRIPSNRHVDKAPLVCFLLYLLAQLLRFLEGIIPTNTHVVTSLFRDDQLYTYAHLLLITRCLERIFSKQYELHVGHTMFRTYHFKNKNTQFVHTVFRQIAFLRKMHVFIC